MRYNLNVKKRDVLSTLNYFKIPIPKNGRIIKTRDPWDIM